MVHAGPFGTLWGTSGILLAHLGATFGRLWKALGRPWVPLDCPGVHFGHFFLNPFKMDITFRANVPQTQRLRIRIKRPELSSGSTGSSGSAGNGPRRAVRDLGSPRAGGKDYVSLRQTPSNQVPGTGHHFEIPGHHF